MHILHLQIIFQATEKNPRIIILSSLKRSFLKQADLLNNPFHPIIVKKFSPLKRAR